MVTTPLAWWLEEARQGLKEDEQENECKREV